MAKNIIFDFETVGNAQADPNVAIPSMAMLVFDPDEQLPFEELVKRCLRIKFNLSEQFNKYGRTYDKETVEWWSKPENKTAYDMVCLPSSIDVDLSIAPSIIKQYLEHMEYIPNAEGDRIWTRGNAFDVPLLENVYKQFGSEVPFPWWNIRDIRTAIDENCSVYCESHKMNGYDPTFVWPEDVIKHREEHDVALDVLMLQHSRNTLRDFIVALVEGE